MSPLRKVQRIKVANIRRDKRTQSRVEWKQDLVAEYATAARKNLTPPIVVFQEGEIYWLADGYYRLAAHEQMGVSTIQAEIRPGDLRAAILYAVGANEHHGLRRTIADRHKAVMTLLHDPEWVTRSSTWIANTCNVSPDLVESLRVKNGLQQEVVTTQTGKKISATKPNKGQKKTASKPVASKPAPAKKPPAMPAFDEADIEDEEDDEDADDANEALAEAAEADAAPVPAEPEPAEVVLDGLKRPVPKKLRAVFESAICFEEAQTRISELSQAIGAIRLRKCGAALAPVEVGARIQAIRDLLRDCRPWVPCPNCDGEGCGTCHERGWMTRKEHTG